MIELLELSEKYTGSVSLDFQRYLMKEINWKNRLIGIKGARGTGKTTMLIQWLRMQDMPASKAAYIPLDDIYFTEHNLVDTGRDFYNKGGKILVLDEVHKYPEWASAIKNLYDRYNDLQIVFTGSSIIDISKQEADLSRRARMYELPGLSFREYLEMNKVLKVEAISLDKLISGKSSRKNFPADFRPLEYFHDYLIHGYYPFYNEDPEGYEVRLRQLVRLIVESDMAELKGFDIRNARKILQLLYIIAQQVPFKPNIIKLGEKSKIHRNSISNYLYFLEEARLIGLLYPAGISTATLQKPEKIFMNNTNLLHAMAEERLSAGTLRETFFFNQLYPVHKLRQPKAGDFEAAGKYVFELGGKGKGGKQIEGLANAFLVKDDIEYPTAGVFPLWIFGCFVSEPF
ncbi:MAG: AAA family ATPase [Bacteroidota bacterium]|nr:AAA family ATPase [Bacteroidota bacterium]